LPLLGRVRHLTEVERVYAGWAGAELEWVWGDYTDDGPERDIDADASMLDESMPGSRRSRSRAQPSRC
jgi:hypothetical protein